MLDYTSNSKFDWQEKFVFAYLDEPPFGFPGVEGQPSGCDVEVALTVLASIGIQQVETRLVTFADLLPGVMKGQWAMNTAIFLTPERNRLVDFSRPVWALPDGFIVKTGNPEALTSYEALAAHPSAKLGVVKETVQRQAALKAGVPVKRIVELTTQIESLEALLTEEIDAFASTALGNRVFVQRANDTRLAVVELASAKGGGEGVLPAFGAFSFAKSNRELRQAFDTALEAYLGSPEHRTLMARYGFTNADIELVVEQR
jgi:polar amino acid transport system substrate-binding protein